MFRLFDKGIGTERKGHLGKVGGNMGFHSNERTWNTRIRIKVHYEEKNRDKGKGMIMKD
jgi:hypothetical protein